ncbi:MAG: helix-turn-helix domain-containing protein [Cyclobacteriaceae bacterium]|nr:helix-turn-helix domain-containing protein [Cyclobacteriaceae bacterium]
MEDIQTTAVRFLNTTSSHIFLTGKAGTGKTTFLKNLNKVTHKNFIVVAPTGIAALNAGGVTIHSQFLLPPSTFLPDRSLSEDFSPEGNFLNQHTLARKHPLTSARKKVLRSIDLLVIDEVSMLRADLLDAMDYRMRAARGNFRKSFGGVQVLFIGDLFQLPPVVRNDEQQVLHRYYKSPWFYEAKALEFEPLIYIELEKIFRQHDPQFINILNNLRANTATTEDIMLLNQHHRTEAEIANVKEVITLTTHNYKADDLNKKALQHLQAPSFFFDAHIEGEFPESMYPVLATLELKEGAQVMFVRNDTSEDKKYVNGKLATVKKISDEEVWVTMAETNEEYLLKEERWENKKYTVNDVSHDLEEEVIGSFEQYPIKLAWAITVHKSQGLTFDKAIIDVGQAFADGQVYVALSRLRSLEGLILRTRIQTSAISTDKHVAAFARANHQPHRLGEVIKAEQRSFLQNELDRIFDFGSLVNNILYVNEKESSGFSEETMKPVLTQLAEAIQTEKVNSERFRRQLTDLLLEGNHALLLERIARGRNYYRSFFLGTMRQLLEHLELVKQMKRVKTYVNHLTELDQALNKKLEEVDKAYLLTEGILQNREEFEFETLHQKRNEERLAMVAEVQKQYEGSVTAGTRKKPRKVRKSKKADGRSTVDITLDYFNAGLSPEQIAHERSLTMGTIETHLAKAVENSHLDILQFVNEDELNEITDAIKLLPTDFTSKHLYDTLQGQYGYGKLRAVVAHVRRMSVE